MKPTGRSLAARIVRGLVLASAAGWLISVTVNSGVSTVLEDRRPDVAVRYSDRNAVALANQAGVLLQTGTSSAMAQARELAVEALRRSPVISGAYAILGFIADGERKPRTAEQLLNVSQSLNRRDFFMHLWFIENLSVKGDVSGTLAHYDVALTTSANATPLLMPILVQAAKDPAIRAGLLPILARRPVWANTFIRDFTAKSDAPLAVAALFVGMRRSGQVVSRERQAEAAERLVRDGLFRQAAAIMDRSPSEPLLADGGFTQADALGPFAWDLTTTYGLGAAREQHSAAAAPSALSFFANRDMGGDAARQLLLLAPGRYQLATVAQVAPASVDAKPAWQLRCADGDKQLVGALALPAAQAPAPATVAVTVPTGCSAQWLVLHVPQSSSLDGVNGQVRQVSIRRIG